MAIKKTQMYRRNLDGTETNLNPLTESQYVLMENGQTVQEVLSDRDSDKYTPVITNSSSTFKVGQGDNVDLSSSMKEGAYDSCVLKGKTMVNCIQELSSKDVVLPYEFADGQYVTINDTKESGALGVELKGQTLVNLFNTKDIVGLNGEMTIEKGVITLPIKNHRYNNFNIPKSKCTMFKPSTKYTMWVNMLENRSEDNEGETQQSGSFWLQTYDYSSSIVKTSNQGTYGCRFENNEVGVKTCVFETHAQNEYDSKSGGLNFELPCYYAKNGGIQRVSIVIMEGDWSNQELPFDKFFTGMTSCKMPILHTVGKNLFDGVIKENNYVKLVEYDSKQCVAITARNDLDGLFEFTKPIPCTKGLTLSFMIQSADYCKIRPVFEDDTFGNQIGSWFGFPEWTKTFYTIPQSSKRLRGFVIGSSSNAAVSYLESSTIQIEQGSTVTAYEPYKSSILSLPEEVVLRSLPNGVCDTFNTKTGVYTQRIGELILDGSLDEYWTDYKKELDTTQAFYASYNIIGKCYDIISNSFPTITKGKIQTSDIEGISTDESNERGFVFIRIKKSRLSTQDTDGFKTWLQSNPVTVQYQLETPIVTKINLSSTLKSWNTTTHVYSEIPEDSLYPTLSHSNPTYPVILKPSTKYSIVANSYGNSHTNSAINFNLGGATASTTVGSRVTTITTPSTLSNELLTMSGRGNKLNNVMVIEGDVVGDEPYFEGICDCKSPILSNVGKNLVDSAKIDNWGNKDTHFEYPHWIRVKPNTKYITNMEMGCWDFYNIDKQYISQSYRPDTAPNLLPYTTPSDCYYVKIRTWGGNSDTNKGLDYYRLNFAMYEVSSSAEPYKSNTTTFEQKDDKTIVLRSLPNGVCDTLNVETGEYVQRIGEVTKNNSTGFGLSKGGWENKSDVCTFEHFKPEGMKVQLANNKPTLICDKVPSNTFSTQWNNSKGIESITQHNGGGIVLSITRDKLLTQDVNGLNTYLQSNPLTIQYELETPITTTIDVQGFPYAYKDGHVQLSSGHDGQSLTPKVEYSLSANKTGQINSNTKRVSAHQKQLDDFEAMMLTSMVQSAYDKAILQFDYEMQMMSLGGE